MCPESCGRCGTTDPACGTDGFLLAAHEHVKSHFELDRDQKRHLRFEALRGIEIVPNFARPCGMNLYLHGIGPDGADDHAPPIRTDDALRDEPASHVRSQEIADDLRSALDQIEDVLGDPEQRVDAGSQDPTL